MATVEGKFPGGRKHSETMEEIVMVGEGEDPASTTPLGGLSPQHRRVSQSLPRFSSTADPRKVNTLPDDLDKSYTLDRKKKSKAPSLRTFGSFMHKMVRQMSQVSLQSAPSPKPSKKRSLSLRRSDKSSSRSRRGSLQSSLETSTETLQNGVPSFSNGKVAGVVGIKNHGNTCFMNAVLQCLSHTDLLVGYFVTDQYRQDIKRNNKHNSKKFGTKGELTEHLAVLLKSLWTCDYTSDISGEFKSVVGKYSSQYRGYAQHDAQEFLMWLLDKVHEDLNIASKKKYRANKGSHGRPDEVVAAEALANQSRCNNSYVYDLFQALYRSSLTCPNCRRQSNTFDPFLSVSLPIPQKTKRPVYVTVVYLDAQPKQVRIGLLMGQGDTVRELRQTLASDTKIPDTQLLLTEIYYDGFHRTFHDSVPLCDIHETDNIYAIETPQAIEEQCPANSQPLVSYLTVVVLNKQGIGNQGRRFGGPMVLQVRRDTTFLDLQNDILHNMVGILRDGIIAQKMGVLFRLRVMDGLPGKCYLLHDVEHPLYLPTVDRALSSSVNGTGPQHIKILAEWDQQTKQCLVASSDDVIEEHASVKQVQMAHERPELGTLDECFQLYTQEERLSGDDAWLCPNCRKRQQGTIKSISLWSLPDTLLVHLKRFKQDGIKRTKLNTLITFPVTGLDMSHHVAKNNQQIYQHSNKGGSGWSPWRPGRRTPSTPEDFVYDLYAVCNHYGNMQGGHYTAFCKNPADSKWYTFDDTKVTEMAEEEVVTRAAYLLFYQRRTTYTCDVGDPAHWIHHLHRLTRNGKRHGVSKSHEDLLDEVTPGSPSTATSPPSFPRSVQVYATLRTPSFRSANRSSTSPPRGSGVVVPRSSSPLTSRQCNGLNRSSSSSTTAGSTLKSSASSPPPPAGPVRQASSSSAKSVGINMSPNASLNSSLSSIQVSSRTLLQQATSLKNTDDTASLAGSGVARSTTAVGVCRSGSCSTVASTLDREVPRIERSKIGITRSITSPDVNSIPVGKMVTRGRQGGEASDDKDLPQWDYKKTVFLQESCV